MVINAPNTETLLGGISTDQFLREYWQKQPRLIKQAWPSIRSPLSAEELAGLACEAEVNSRLVDNSGDHWTVRNGPHSESTFMSIGDSNWTLLVPDCEKFITTLQQLIDPFRFIPNWRIDDVMLSYATDGGGVGPHVDEYDVFLLQLEGQRRWQIDPHPKDLTLRDDCELAILNNFNAVEDWVLDAGDMLYLPPGVAHHGIACGNCFTASIGFRAPLANNLAMDFASQITPHRYTDQNLSPTTHPAELSDAALASLADSIKHVFSDQSHFPQWAGEFLTTSSSPISDDQELVSIDDFKIALTGDALLTRSPWSKLLYYRGTTELTLFADAISFRLGIDYLSQIQMVCESNKIRFESADLKNKDLLQLLYELYLQGTLLLDT